MEHPRIYLQVEENEVSWCDHRVHDTDVEYVRAEPREREDAVIATSSLELGIDIGSVDRVIQIMSPRQTSTFLQRVGRSGHRLEQTSEGIMVLSNPRDALEGLVIAKQALDHRLEPTRKVISPVPPKFRNSSPCDHCIHHILFQ